MNKKLGALFLLGALAAPALADISAVVVIEPTSRKDGFMVSRAALESNLSRLIGQNVNVVTTEDMTDAMRATRSAGYDIFVAPPQIVASALHHGYELIGSTDLDEQYVLVGKPSVPEVGNLRSTRIYLPQQDSIYTYMARGMLTASGLSFKDLRKVEYARYPQAGLTAVSLGMSEATVIRRNDWDAWDKQNPGTAKILATSGAVPGGFSVAISGKLPTEVRSKVARWFTTSAQSSGLKPVQSHSDLSEYKRVAALGTFTPTSLPGATVVTAQDVKRLMAEGAVLVDARNEQEFKQAHIPGALFVPYHEKSLKDVAYDASLDDFSGLAKLDKSKPTIFQCNGPECWKSYKASRSAITKGFAKVYWFRGGLPEWESSGLKVAQGPK